MFTQTFHRPVPIASAIVVAGGLHLGLALGVIFMPKIDFVPPQAVGGFEVVDLSAFGVAAQPEPDVEEEQPVEDTPVEAETAEPQPEVAEEVVPPEPEPLPQPVVQAKPKPQPTPKPKPEVRPTPRPKPEPVHKPKPQAQPQKPPQTAIAGSQNAYVPPSSTAAYLRNPKPTYPAIAQRRGMEGVVLLLVEVSVTGEPLSVKVKQGSGYSILDKAALRAVSAWRFAPATRGGRSVQAAVEVPIRFVLNDA